MLASDLPAWLIRASAFIFGSLWGSFFNVAIYRWPRELSVVSPPSHCTHCQTPIPAYRNIPIIGYLILRGKTACCGKRLNPRYALVELCAAALCLALAEVYIVRQPANAHLGDQALTTLLFFFFVGGLLIATFVDLEHMEIPDEVSIGGAALGLATVSLRQPGPDALDVAIGAGAGFLVVQILLVWSWERLAGHRGMGEGDSKFLLFIGAFLGWKGAIFALVGGAFQGIIAAGITTAVSAMRRRGEEEEESGELSEEEKDRWVAPPPLELPDGTKAELHDAGERLDVKDDKGRLLWEYVIMSEGDPLRRAIPFGPFLALGALEFLFFGERLVELYLGLFE